MRKIYLFLVFFVCLLLTSCTDNTTKNYFKLKNVNNIDGAYIISVEEESFDISNYVDTNCDYVYTYKDNLYYSKDNTLITLNKGQNTVLVRCEELNIDYQLYVEYTSDIKVLIDSNYSSKNEYTFEYGTKLSKDLFEVSREGYTWNGMVSYRYANDDECMPFVGNIEDITLKKDIILSFILDANEYEISVDGTKYLIRTDEIINIEEPTLLGHTFKGYNVSEFKNGATYHPSMGFEFTSVFNKNTYTLFYEYMGNFKEVSIKYMDRVEEFIPEVPGYKFVGWAKDGEIVQTNVYEYTSDVTYKAVFEANTYKITYTNILEEYTVDVKYESNIILPTPSKEGFKFLYWTLDGNVYDESIFRHTSNIELVAVWEEVHLSKVNLSLNSFGGVCESEVLVDEDGFINLPVPKKEGYIFKYWCFDNDLKNIVTSLKESEYTGETLYACYSLDSTSLIGEVVITRRNSHATNYDELAIFDGSMTGYTSKYWHKIGIKKNDDSYYVSAIAINGEALSSLGECDFVVLAYTDYTGYSYFTNLGYEVGTEVFFSVDPRAFTESDVTIQMSFVAPNIEDDKEELISLLTDLYKDYESVSENIELVDSLLNYTITWKTSNKNAISSKGVYTKPYVTRNVTLTASVGEEELYSFTVEVLGEKETSDALATGYIYTPYTITENAMATLDIIYCAFLNIDENANWTNYTRMKSNLEKYIIPLAKKTGTKVVISVNQENANKAFSTVSASAELREKLATNILLFIQELGIDGIDIDWETPASSEAKNFTLLMEAIYKKVKAANPDYLVTAAIGGGMWAPPKYDLPNSKNYLDYINLMTYSMATGNGYYQNSLYKSTKGATLVSCSIEESIKIYNDLGVKNSQILVGIPFYTTVQTSSGGPGSKTGSGKSVWYDKMLANYPLSDTMKEYFDEECGVPYRYDATTQVFISYDNERSIMIKCDYINTLGLAGIMYWQYGQDVDDMLSNAINKYINN